MVSIPLPVKSTFIVDDCDLNCEDGSLSLSRRQFSPPCLSGPSPLRDMESFEENEADFSLEKAKELPSPEGLQSMQPSPHFEPEGEPHSGMTAPLGAGQTLRAPRRPLGQRWADMDDPCISSQHPPKTAFAGKLQSPKEALKPLLQHRVSFQVVAGPEALPSGDGQQDELGESDIHPFCRFVTGGSDYAADASVACDGGAAATAPMAASYFAGMSQEGTMPMVPFLVPGGGYPGSESYAWAGQGLYPIVQQPLGMMMPSQQQMMYTPQETPRQQRKQGHESPSEARHSSSNQRIVASTKHSRGRGSLIDIAKREQALRQRTMMTDSTHGQTKSATATAQMPQQSKTALSFCPYCRGKVQMHHRFCQFCGASLSSW